MDTTAALDAALDQNRACFFVATQVDLPSAVTVRLVDGSGEVTWAQGNFVSSHAVFGVLDNIDQINDGVGDQAPQLSLAFIPANGASAAALCSPAFQGSRLRVWIGALDLTTKAVVADPYLIFDGEIDQPTLTVDSGDRIVGMECVSSFEKLFRDDEGIRLNPANHKFVWPGETGLDDVTGIVRQVLWGPGKKFQSAAPGAGTGTGSTGFDGAQTGIGGGLSRFFGINHS